MITPRLPSVELDRMKELLRLEILDSQAEAEFDEIVSIASYITGCPISLISLVDSGRQWFKAKIGLEASETGRDISFCGHAILGNEILIVENAAEDERFRTNPLVENDPRIRFYAGQPLITSNGYKIGTLCTIDRYPKKLDEAQKRALSQLAKHAVHLIEVRLAKRRSEADRDLSQAILDSTAEGIWGVNIDGTVSFINKQGLKIFGYTQEDQVIGKMSHKLFHHSHEDGSTYITEECPIFKGLHAGQPVYIESDVFWRADGSSFIGEYRSQPLNVNGKLHGAVVSFFDITDKVFARKKLEQSEIQFGVLANSIPQLAWMARADGFIYWYNQNWYDYTGTTPDQMKGWGWQVVHDPEILDDVMKKWSESIATGMPFMMEFPLKNRDGEFRWFITRASPVRDDKNKVVAWIGSNTDIHDQKQSIRALENERDIRERFVATLSHDLRTPLTAAKITAQLLERKLSSHPDLRKMADRIAATMDRADSMITDLLDANRIKAGEGIPVAVGQERIDKLISNTLEELSRVHGAKFEFLNDAGPVEGFWDASGIQRAIENLAGNAVKYGSPNSPINVALKVNNNEIEISVHNQGNPIALEDQKNLFGAYRRTDAAIASGKIGWGIGLSLVKGLAEAHGGRASVNSNFSAGTTFSIHLPLDSRKFTEAKSYV
jgi:PAS domain S-box-containing protein